MRLGILVLLTGCLTESGGGGGNFNKPKNWYAGTDEVGPLVFDATHTHYEYTLEGSINLTRSRRLTTQEITGLTVIGELTQIGTGARIRVTLSHEGEEPGLYGSKLAQGPYTYNHAEPVVLSPLEACYTAPCTASERYTLTFDTDQNPGSVEVMWRASLHALLEDTEGDMIDPPEDDETLAVTIAPSL